MYFLKLPNQILRHVWVWLVQIPKYKEVYMKKLIGIILIILLLVSALPVAAISTIEVKSIKFANSKITVSIGQTSALKVTFTPENTSQKLLTYTTNNKKIATVDSNGQITGIRTGTVTITAYTSNNNIFAKCTVTVSRPVYVEWWQNNEKGITWKKDGPVSQWLVKNTGVGMYMPLVIWDGGNGYFTKLQTRIATNDLPDIFMPLKGIETSLIQDDLIWDLKTYLHKYAPHIWNKIPQNVWEVIRANDPTGKGGIHYLPYVTLHNDYGLFMRKDWLDAVGLGIPKNQAEYVAALKAFRDNDPNKNGQKDEIPTIGREFGRWMDHLFFMYDVSMFEGYPVWDVYNGQITYSATTPNMKEALKFIRMLYQEKLLDNDTFLNKANDLWAKVSADKVGSWYHIPRDLNTKVLLNVVKINPKVEVVVLPKIAAPGYNGYISNTQIWGPSVAFAKKDEKTLIASLKMMDWLNDKANFEKILYGVEGLHHTVKDGKKVLITEIDFNKVEKPFKPDISLEGLMLTNKIAYDNEPDISLKNLVQQTINAIKDSQKGQGKAIAQNGMPSSVYDGFPDIASHKIYQEYMTKIIIGELPIEAFDEFITKWNAAGGAEVTKRVRNWYKNVKR